MTEKIQITSRQGLPDPRELLPRAIAVLEDVVEREIQIGAQLYISRDLKPLADFGLGEARQGLAMGPETMMIWFSSTKPVTALAIGQLWERGLVRLDDPVAKYIPEFGNQGKEAVTIRQVLTHTGGFRFADGPPDSGAAFIKTWDEIIAAISAAPLEPGWVPKKKAGYHPTSGWFILGEILQRVTGRSFSGYVREEIFLPLGMTDCWIGMPPEVYTAYGERIGYMHGLRGGRLTQNPMEGRADVAAKCIPGGGGRGPMNQMGRLYEALLNGGELDGARILTPQTVEAMTARHRSGMFDETFKAAIDWGLGFILAIGSYGAYSSWRSFGHGGARSSIVFCDPQERLVFASVHNGMPDRADHHARCEALATAVYEDLGLVKPGERPRKHVSLGSGLV